MKTKLNITILLVFSILSVNAFTQVKTISGTISGIDGKLEGVKVQVINTKITTTTDSQGNYSIELPESATHITYSANKMEKTLRVDNQTNSLDVLLIPNEKKLFKAINERNELRLCDIYENYYPTGKNIDEVKKLREKYLFIQAYNIAASQFSDTALRNYLKIYPDGAYKQKAFDAIEIAAWQKARYENTVDAYQDYINRYPSGKAVNMAKEKIASLQ